MTREDVAMAIRYRLTPERALQALSLLKGATRQAGGFLIRCPAHDDSTASCSVILGMDKTTRVKCFGCDLAGDVFHLVAAKFRLDLQTEFPRVLYEAGRACGVDVPWPDGAGAGGSGRWRRPSPPARPEPPPPPTRSLERYQPTDAERAFEQGALVLFERSPLHALGVALLERGLLDEAVADGWGELPRNEARTGAARQFDARAGFDVDDQALSDLARELGSGPNSAALSWLMREGRVVRPGHRLLIPWRRPDGSIWTVQRRNAPGGNIHDAPPKGEPKYLFPSQEAYAPEARWPYGAHRPEVASAEEVWLVEGAVDALAVRALGAAQPGKRAVLGLAGVQSWDKLAPAILPLVRGRKVVIATDGDNAGECIVAKLSTDLHGAGAGRVTRVVARGREGEPRVKDWAELLALRTRGEGWRRKHAA